MKSIVLVYILTYGGLAASLFNPFIGLLGYVCLAILRPEGLWFYSLPAGGNLSRIVAIGLILGWAISGFGKWKLGRSGLIVTLLACYWAWSALGAVLTGSPESWAFVESLSKIALPFI